MSKSTISLFMFGVGGMIFWFLAFPLYSGAGQSVMERQSVQMFEREKAAAEKELEAAQKLKARAEAETEAYNGIPSETKSVINSFFVKEREIPALYNDVTKLIEKSKFRLENISHSVGTSPNPNLKVTTFSLSVRGNYLDLPEFLNTLQQSKPLYKIKSMNFTSLFSPDGRNIDSTGTRSQLFTITFELYELK